MIAKIKVKHGQEQKFQGIPIQPEWILQGNPGGKGQLMMQSHDRKQTAGIWECDAGKFEYHYHWHETLRILEGEATMEDDDGVAHLLRPGDYAHFPMGVKSIWTVPERLKLLFFIVTPEPFEL